MINEQLATKINNLCVNHEESIESKEDLSSKDIYETLEFITNKWFYQVDREHSCFHT